MGVLFFGLYALPACQRQPKKSGAACAGRVAGFGHSIPDSGLISAGSVADASPTAVIASLLHTLGPLGTFALAAIALSSITGNSFNDNTASYSLISAGVHVPELPQPY